MDWYIWLAIIVGALIFLYFFLAICVHMCKYKTYKGTESMVGKTVFITGGTSGIGRQSVIDLYLRGFKVFFTGRNVKAAHEVVGLIAKKLQNCKLFREFS